MSDPQKGRLIVEVEWVDYDWDNARWVAIPPLAPDDDRVVSPETETREGNGKP